MKYANPKWRPSLKSAASANLKINIYDSIFIKKSIEINGAVSVIFLLGFRIRIQSIVLTLNSKRQYITNTITTTTTTTATTSTTTTTITNNNNNNNSTGISPGN